MTKYLIVLLSVVLAACGQVLLKKGASAGTSVMAIAGSLHTWVGLFCYFLSAIMWVAVLSRMDLSYVYPFTIVTYILVMVAAHFLLGERAATKNLVIGSIFIIIGIITINLRT